MVGVTYGIQPYGGHPLGWTSPSVIGCLTVGVLTLAAFGVIEAKVRYPMFRLSLFRIKAFSFGTISTFLAALGRGGLMFMLIIWLQGIWLPLHGYSFERTPFWAGVYMLPMTAGFLLAGPIAGRLSDRFGSRPFATGGMIAAAAAFVLLELLPINFSYPAFAAILLLNGLAMGAFAAPNRAGVMNSLPARDRGAGGGMNSTFMNSAQVFSLGIFFSLMIAGLAADPPHTLSSGLIAQGVPVGTAEQISHLPPISILFASFLGYNPIGHLLGAGVLLSPASGQGGRTDRPQLPARPAHRPVPGRPAHRVRLLHRLLPDRRRGVLVARRQVRRRRARAHPARRRARADPGGRRT